MLNRPNISKRIYLPETESLISYYLNKRSVILVSYIKLNIEVV
jgi:hypothetical protein